jgi:hypothetical protein
MSFAPSGSACAFRTSNVSSHFESASFARWDASFSPSSKTPKTVPAITIGTLPVPRSWVMSERLTCRLPASVSVPESIPIWWACNARRSRVGLIGYIPTLAAAPPPRHHPRHRTRPHPTRHAPKSSRVLATSHQCARKSASTVAIPAIIEPVIAIAAGMALGNSRLITVATKIAATGRTITK